MIFLLKQTERSVCNTAVCAKVSFDTSFKRPGSCMTARGSRRFGDVKRTWQSRKNGHLDKVPGTNVAAGGGRVELDDRH